MSTTINVASYLKPYLGGSESVTVQGKTVRECLDDLVTRYPEMKKMVFKPDGRLHEYVCVMASGDVAFDDQLDVAVKDGEALHILYVIGGG